MGVTISSVSGTPFTWASSNFAWNSPSAGKPWNALSPTNYTMTVAEVVNLPDANPNAVVKPLFDSFGITGEAVDEKTLGKVTPESFQLSEGQIQFMCKSILVSVTFNKLHERANNVTTIKNESFSITESVQEAYWQSLEELFHIMETYIEQSSFNLRMMEHVNIGEDNLQTFSKALFDSFGFEDSAPAFILNKVISELVSVSEAVYKNSTKNTVESFNLNDVIVAKSVQFLCEYLGAEDELSNSTKKVSTENFSLTDTIQDMVSWVRVATETFALGELKRFTTGQNIRESLAVYDDTIRNSNTIISDLYYGTGDLSISDFMSNDSPVGFSNFKDFVIGDYNYKQAIIKMIVSSGVTTSIPRILSYKYNVDVPDSTDGGYVTLTAAITRVDFSRPFFSTPEVAVKLKSCLVLATPSITSIDDTGFYVKINSNSDGSLVAGEIRWDANGF